MLHRPGLLILWFTLFVLSANSAWACDQCTTGKCINTTAEPSCCAKKNPGKDAHSVEKTKACKQHQPHKCPEKGGCGGCPCPCGTVTSGHSGGFLAEFPPDLTPVSYSSESTLRQAFYFDQHMPEAVYLPIWQPPKLAV